MLDEKQLEAILEDVREQSGVPGIGAALCFPDRELAAASGQRSTATWAPLTAETHFDVSCLMKFFASIATLETVAAGHLDLDTTVASVLPEFEGDSDSKGNKIQVQHLLSHTSGYRGMDITDPRVRWNTSWRDVVLWVSSAPQLFEVGQMFNYEHSEHVILNKMLDRATDRNALRIVTEKLLEPLNVGLGLVPSANVENGSYADNHVYSVAEKKFVPVSVPPPCATWQASLPNATICLRDIARVAYQLVSSERMASTVSLSALTRECVVTKHIALPSFVSSDPRAERTPKSFGLLCGGYGDGVFGHNGSSMGQTCAVRIVPSLNLAIAVGTNCWSPFARDEALRKIIAAVMGRSLPAVGVSHTAGISAEAIFSDLDPGALQGRYLGGYMGQVVVRNEGADVVCEIGKTRKSFRIAKGEGRTYVIESPVPLSVAFLQAGARQEPVLFLGVHGYRRCCD